MKQPVTYKTSGVDIARANAFVKAIQGHVAATKNDSVLKDKGAFGSLFSLDIKSYQNPVLVSSTDGVGTKLLLAKTLNKHDSVGIDLVAMNVNDILCVGAKPLFFLDYIACGKVNVRVLKDVVKGISAGCQEAGCALIGGETAEMPGMYKKDDYDLAGFAVGIVEKDKIINGSTIREGDILLGLPSSGLHSNGFSLVRKVLSLAEQKKFGRELLEPTRIYVKEILDLIEQVSIKGIAHMTGGAFYEKLTKILPEGLCFSIRKGSWPIAKIFSTIQEKGRIKEFEMYRTLNMGIGLAITVDPLNAPVVKAFFKERKLECFEIGTVVKDSRKKVVFN